MFAGLLYTLSPRYRAKHHQQGSGEHHIDARINQRQPRVANHFQYRILAHGTHLRVIAVLVDFPSVHLYGFVHFDSGLNLFSCLRLNLDVGGKTTGRTVVVGLHNKLLQFDGDGHLHNLLLQGQRTPFGFSLHRNHLQTLHVGIAQCSGSYSKEQAKVVQYRGER